MPRGNINIIRKKFIYEGYDPMLRNPELNNECHTSSGYRNIIWILQKLLLDRRQYEHYYIIINAVRQ